MIRWEMVLLWAAVALYAASAASYVASLFFSWDRWTGWATRLAELALAPHTLSLLLRWLEAGHGPYLRRYEVYSSDVWVGVVMFLLAQRWRPSLRGLGAVVMPASFLLIGMAVMSSPEIRTMPPSFRTYWLVIHILFAKLAYGANLIATGCAVLYLMKRRRTERDLPVRGLLAKVPDLAPLDELSYAFSGFGFLMIGIMILAGSIWAKNAWGSYWNWDAVETWALISWFVYGIYLHLRRTHGWKGSRAAWMNIAALGFLLFALFGVGLFFDSAHSPYVG